MSLAEAEGILVAATLAHFLGDKPRSARTLGISLKTLYNKLDAYGLRETAAELVKAATRREVHRSARALETS
jgi:DNA-binding NtrC family response regulator